MTPERKRSDRVQVSATVTPDVKAALAARAEAEERPDGYVLRRALRLYLALPVEDADRMLRESNGAGKAPEG